MPVNIQSMAEVKVSNLKTLIYGPPGVGKTTLALATRDPLILDCDRGTHRAVNSDVPGVWITDWGRDMDGFNAEMLRPFKTVIVDTVGTALDLMLADIVQKNARLRQSGGAPTQQAFGVLLQQFNVFLTTITNAGVDVVLVAHATEHNDDGRLVQRIKATGQSAQNVQQQADLIGRLWLENGERRLSFNPQFASLGKNIDLPDTVIPPIADRPLLLAEMMDDAKRTVNSRSGAGRIYYRLLEAEQNAETPDALVDNINQIVCDASITPLSDWQPDCKRLLANIQERGGLIFDQAERRFVLPAPAAPPADAPVANPASIAPNPPPSDDPPWPPPDAAAPPADDSPDSLF